MNAYPNGDGQSIPQKPHKFKTHLLKRLPDQKYDDKPYAMVDIETGILGELTLGGSLVYGQLRFSDSPEHKTEFYSEREFFELLLKSAFRGKKVYAHNGMGYDFLYCARFFKMHADEYKGLSINCLIRGDGRVIEMTLTRNKHVVKLRDTLTLIQGSLKEISHAIAPEYEKLERVWENEDGSINYFDPRNPEDIAYADNDVVGLLVSFDRYKRIIYETFGVNVGLTAASTAMKAWRHSFDESQFYWRQRPAVEDLCRESYAGGLVFLTTTDCCVDMVHVDYNAMFAAAMRLGVPVGSGCKVDGWRDYAPGFYRCTVDVPEDEVYPFIPYFIGEGQYRTMQWRRGHFATTLPSITIEYARSLGYHIDVGEGYIFEGIEKIFDTILEKCEAIEREHKGDALGMAAKAIRNSLYGKFGARPVAERLFIGDDPDGVLTPVCDPQTSIPEDHVFKIKEPLSEPYMMPHWASWITAQARILLNKTARATHAVYGDTDSCVFPRENLTSALETGVFVIGKAYGQIKVEHEYEAFIPVAPKNYLAYTTPEEDKETGEMVNKWVDRMKGIPKKELDTLKHLLASTGDLTTVHYHGMISMRTLLTNATNELIIPRHRKYSDISSSTSWERHCDGSVWARMVSPEEAGYAVKEDRPDDTTHRSVRGTRVKASQAQKSKTSRKNRLRTG